MCLSFPPVHSSQGKKNYSENDQSLAQPPRECGGAPISGGFQDAIVQGASH